MLVTSFGSSRVFYLETGNRRGMKIVQCWLEEGKRRKMVMWSEEGIRFGNNERRLRNGMSSSRCSRKYTDFGAEVQRENIPKLQPTLNFVCSGSPALAPGGKL